MPGMSSGAGTFECFFGGGPDHPLLRPQRVSPENGECRSDRRLSKDDANHTIRPPKTAIHQPSIPAELVAQATKGQSVES
jgi:hypothetical protein